MIKLNLMAGLGAAVFLGACAGGVPKDMSVADYCANPDNIYENVCRVKVEIDGNTKALADTNMSLQNARNIADAALSAAGQAQGTADRALQQANTAMQQANQSMLREDQLYCETQKIQKTNIGSCSPGYTLMSCTQTRFTYRAGGMSILREIDDKQCRFNDRVLEMQVRCCKAGAGPSPRVAQNPAPTVARQAPPRTYAPAGY